MYQGSIEFPTTKFGHEHVLDVRFEHTPGRRGSYFHPPEPDTTEITEITCENGHEWSDDDLTSEELKEIEEECFDKAGHLPKEYEDARSEAEFERKKDEGLYK